MENVLRSALLYLGVVSSLLYVAMNIFVAAQDARYSSLSQTVSELSAIGAPTRNLWVGWSFLYTFLVMGFGVGIWKTARDPRIHILAALIFCYGALGLGWPFAPMHTREVLAAGGGTFSDTMHIAFSIVTVLMMLAAMGAGFLAFGSGFRLYTFLTILILCVFGILTALEAPAMEANLATPFMGLWERINIGVFLLWICVLSYILVKRLNMLVHRHGGLIKASGKVGERATS